MRPVIFTLTLIAGTALSLAIPRAQTFPSTTAADLNGRQIKVPDDLNGSPAILLVAFEREQQRDIDRLTPLFSKAKALYSDLRVWEVPVINNPGAIGRFAIDTGMKAGVPNTATRAGVVTLYVADRAAWAKSIGLPEKQDVYAVVLGKSAKVLLWKPAKELATQSDIDAFLSAAVKIANTPG